MLLFKKTSVNPSPIHGNGLYASKPIEEGETIYVQPALNRRQDTFSRRQILSVPCEEERENISDHSFMVDDDHYIFLNPADHPWFSINHSCSPNCHIILPKSKREMGLQNRFAPFAVVASRGVGKGEELTIDYATFDTEMSFHCNVDCKCNSPTCRGKILTGREYRDPQWVAVNSGKCSVYVQHRIESTSYHHPNAYKARRTEDDAAKDLCFERGTVALLEAYNNNPIPNKLEMGILEEEEGDLGGLEECGMYAGGPIKKGDVVIIFTGLVVSTNDILKCKDDRHIRYSIQVNDNLWQLPMDNRPGYEVSEFINHSCDANCGMEDSVTVVAMRDIEQGEELTFDYAMCNNGISKFSCDNFQCYCSSDKCRGNVTASDWQLESVQNQYWPYFSPHVRKLILQKKEVM